MRGHSFATNGLGVWIDFGRKLVILVMIMGIAMNIVVFKAVYACTPRQESREARFNYAPSSVEVCA